MSAVVLDVGNVLYDWDPRYLYEGLIDEPDALDDFLARVVTTEWHFQHDAGRKCHSVRPAPSWPPLIPSIAS